MVKGILRQIPNAATCGNLFSGCVACVKAFEMDYTGALTFILLGAVFDFFDGMLARLLRVSGPLGKELDSLADDVTFGAAPSFIVFSLLREVSCPDRLLPVGPYLPYAAFLIAVFSALRLGKFNIDARQTSSFIGLPTPAHALFWGALVIGTHDWWTAWPGSLPVLILLVCLTSWLLVAEIPMFSLKFKNLSWRDNKVRYLFLLGCIPLIGGGGMAGLSAAIVWYVLLSALTRRRG